MPLSPRFFLRPTVDVARSLLGMRITTNSDDGVTSGIIVEVEAYDGRPEFVDEASHSYRGKTARTDVMFRRGGHVYVYLIYGMHRCMNVVTGPEGIGAAVLVRALEPVEGIDLMRTRRNSTRGPDHLLCSGPGRLCKALGVDGGFNGELLGASTRIVLDRDRDVPASVIRAGPRVGISKAVDFPWRFWIADSPAVSKGAVSSRR